MRKLTDDHFILSIIVPRSGSARCQHFTDRISKDKVQKHVKEMYWRVLEAIATKFEEINQEDANLWY